MRKWLPLLAICLGSFMLLVDVTIVNVALPDMARDLSASFASLQWVIDAYALALAALLLGIGSVADNLGHRRIYLGGLVVFAAASLACGLAPNGGALIAARGVQGIGGAAMFATTFALLNASYQGRDRATAYGIWGGVSGAAAALGPIVGGLLTEAISWRWIFFVNLPVGAATVVLTSVVVTANGASTRKRVDVPGMAAFTVAAAALTLSLVETSNDGWTSPLVLSLFAMTVIALAVFGLLQTHRSQPLIELGMFRQPMFSGVVLAGAVLSFSAFAAITYTTIWTQSLLGLSPIASGLTNLPLPVLSSTLSITTGRLMHRVPSGSSDPSSTAHALIGGEARRVLHTTAPGTRSELDRAMHTAFASGLDISFVIAGGTAVVASAVIAWLVRDRSATAEDAVPGPRRTGTLHSSARSAQPTHR